MINISGYNHLHSYSYKFNLLFLMCIVDIVFLFGKNKVSTIFQFEMNLIYFVYGPFTV